MGNGLADAISSAQEYMAGRPVDGWLLYDYRGMNAVFWDTVGPISNVTRPCWLWVPKGGQARFLVGFVDQGRFGRLGVPVILFRGRENMVSELRAMLAGAVRVAMEYSPMAELPRASRVDAGIVELVRSLGVEVVSSADIFQHATQRWTEPQLQSHLEAARHLSAIVHEAFDCIGVNLGTGVTEHDVADFIRKRFGEVGLEVTDGPIVAVNDHASDPHFEPTPENARQIKRGDWVLIDLWARMAGEDTMYSDITWTAYVGDRVPERHRKVFEAVIGARDAAVDAIAAAFQAGRPVQGWELDRVARDYIDRAGYGKYFNHRLGHSLGREVHGNAVNLDSWETRDTRFLLPGLAVTAEPGIYLPEFGVRSEIDIYITEKDPQITTDVQHDVVLISG
ncbi:MAG: M24 family metallopeptidase [SAR202 cluster bacterium]|nr:M24 family metallopeptidase [SAR202 cluster bacterium]